MLLIYICDLILPNIIIVGLLQHRSVPLCAQSVNFISHDTYSIESIILNYYK